MFIKDGRMGIYRREFYLEVDNARLSPHEAPVVNVDFEVLFDGSVDRSLIPNAGMVRLASLLAFLTVHPADMPK
jgi:hypothetical protein